MCARKKSSKVLEAETNAEVRRLLASAAPQAAQTLIDALSEDSLKKETRIDCAKEILNRIYGKTLQINETDNEIRIVMSKDVQKLAE
ncbi:MAG: hypothetical protein IJP33_02125 [Firmicutes bacterium]|nr:hypothetical protein [Bacillota bacterium]